MPKDGEKWECFPQLGTGSELPDSVRTVLPEEQFGTATDDAVEVGRLSLLLFNKTQIKGDILHVTGGDDGSAQDMDEVKDIIIKSTRMSRDVGTIQIMIIVSLCWCLCLFDTL